MAGIAEIIVHGMYAESDQESQLTVMNLICKLIKDPRAQQDLVEKGCLPLLCHWFSLLSTQIEDDTSHALMITTTIKTTVQSLTQIPEGQSFIIAMEELY